MNIQLDMYKSFLDPSVFQRTSCPSMPLPKKAKARARDRKRKWICAKWNSNHLLSSEIAIQLYYTYYINHLVSAPEFERRKNLRLLTSISLCHSFFLPIFFVFFNSFFISLLLSHLFFFKLLKKIQWIPLFTRLPFSAFNLSLFYSFSQFLTFIYFHYHYHYSFLHDIFFYFCLFQSFNSASTPLFVLSARPLYLIHKTSADP